jgi:hypothetical protein
MFLAIALVLGILWALGLLTGYTLGGAVHLLLAGTVVMMLFGLRQWWRKPADEETFRSSFQAGED